MKLSTFLAQAVPEETEATDYTILIVLLVIGICGFGIHLYLKDDAKGNDNATPSSTDQTQEEILSQLKQINWAIRIGFLYIMGVISGIIPAGVFG